MKSNSLGHFTQLDALVGIGYIMPTIRENISWWIIYLDNGYIMSTFEEIIVDWRVFIFPFADTFKIHSGEKSNKCSQCNKSFNRAEHLISHMLTHTGEKPHKCTRCPKSFSQDGNLNAHLLTYTGEKPHSCSECDKTELGIRHFY